MSDLDIKAENRLVSDWLLYYHERLSEYNRRRGQVSFYQSPQAGDGIRAQGQTSDPTAQRALKLVEGHYDPRWFDLILDVEQMLPEKQRVFLEVRREALGQTGGRPGRPAWVAYVQCRYPLAMAKLTGKDVEIYYIGHPNTYTLWWNRLVEFTARIAIRKGLL